MSLNIGELYGTLGLDTKPFDRALGDTDRKLGGLGDTGKQVADTVATTLGGAAVMAAFDKLRQKASGLQQAVGGTEAVFGDLADKVSDFAKGAAESVGLSEQETREMTSRIGASLKAFGFSIDEAADKAIDLTKVGADLAATYGGTTSEAVDALGAALRGEFDPLERFGISLRQSAIDAKAVELGLAASTSQVDQHARAVATLATIHEQGADALGQFTAQLGTEAEQAQVAAAKTANSQAELGQKLLPIYAAIEKAIGQVADIFAALPSGAQSAILAMVGIVAVAGPISNAIRLWTTLKGAVTSETAAVEANTVAQGENATLANAAAGANARAVATTSKLATASGLLATALAGVAIGYSAVQTARNEAQGMGDDQKSRWESEIAGAKNLSEFMALATEATRQYNDAVADAQTVDIGASGVSISDWIQDDSLIQMLQVLQPLVEHLQDVKDGIVSLGQATGDQDAATQLIVTHLQQFLDLLDAGATPQDAAAQIQALATATQIASGGVDTLGNEVEQTKRETKNWNDALERAVSNLRDLFGLKTSGEEAMIGLRNVMRDMGDAQQRVNDGTLTGQERIDEFSSLIVRGRDSILDYVESMLRQGATTEEAAAKANELFDGLFKIADQTGLTRDEVLLLRTEFGLMPDQVTATIETNAPDVLADVQAIIKAYEDLGARAVDTSVIIPKPGVGQVGQFADGGTVPGAMGAAMVAIVHGGEVVLNPQQQQIVNAGGVVHGVGGATSAGGGGGLTVVQNVTLEGDEPNPSTLWKLERAAARAAADAAADVAMAVGL